MIGQLQEINFGRMSRPKGIAHPGSAEQSSVGQFRAAPATREFSPAEPSSGEEDWGEQATWDEEYVILFFGGNSQVAQDRHSNRSKTMLSVWNS